MQNREKSSHLLPLPDQVPKRGRVTLSQEALLPLSTYLIIKKIINNLIIVIGFD